MSTIFDIRNLRLPKLSRASLIIGALVVVAALVLVFFGFQLYKKLTNNTVVAYFPAANALYNGDRVEIMGVKVGAIDKVEPAGDRMKVTFHYANKYKVPANAQAVILNPTLVASRLIQLEPPYKGGPVLADHAVARKSAPRFPPSTTNCVTASPTSSPSWGRQKSSPRARSVKSSSRSRTGWPARASRSTPPSTTCPER